MILQCKIKIYTQDFRMDFNFKKNLKLNLKIQKIAIISGNKLSPNLEKI